MSDGPVTKEYYKPTSKAMLAACRKHAADIAAATDAHWAILKTIPNSAGYRPGSWDRKIKSVFFKQNFAPEGWKKIAVDGERIECVPVRNTKIGRAAVKLLESSPSIPTWSAFADAALNWQGRSPMAPHAASHRTGMAVYHSGGVHVTNPKESFWFVLPRQAKDKWVAPEGIKQMRESDMLRAIEIHNEIAAKKRKTKGIES